MVVRNGIHKCGGGGGGGGGGDGKERERGGTTKREAIRSKLQRWGGSSRGGVRFGVVKGRVTMVVAIEHPPLLFLTSIASYPSIANYPSPSSLPSVYPSILLFILPSVLPSLSCRHHHHHHRRHCHHHLSLSLERERERCPRDLHFEIGVVRVR
jgi:hypothetical protein